MYCLKGTVFTKSTGDISTFLSHCPSVDFDFFCRIFNFGHFPSKKGEGEKCFIRTYLDEEEEGETVDAYL